MTALFWGAVAGSAVLLGALTSLLIELRKKWIGIIMAYGTGVLLAAAILELLLEAVKTGGLIVAVLGISGGALFFTIADLFIHRKGGGERKLSNKNPENHSGLAIFIGTIIDAIPESVIIGTSLLEGKVSIMMVAAIFISNFPEGLSSTTGLLKDGYSKKKILVLWGVVLILSSVSSFVGFYFLEDTSEQTLAFISAFASGGIIAMVSSTMMPEAFEEGGPMVGFISVVGLISALVLEQL